MSLAQLVSHCEVRFLDCDLVVISHFFDSKPTNFQSESLLTFDYDRCYVPFVMVHSEPYNWTGLRTKYELQLHSWGFPLVMSLNCHVQQQIASPRPRFFSALWLSLFCCLLDGALRRCFQRNIWFQGPGFCLTAHSWKRCACLLELPPTISLFLLRVYFGAQLQGISSTAPDVFSAVSLALISTCVCFVRVYWLPGKVSYRLKVCVVKIWLTKQNSDILNESSHNIYFLLYPISWCSIQGNMHCIGSTFILVYTMNSTFLLYMLATWFISHPICMMQWKWPLKYFPHHIILHVPAMKCRRDVIYTATFDIPRSMYNISHFSPLPFSL